MQRRAANHACSYLPLPFDMAVQCTSAAHPHLEQHGLAQLYGILHLPQHVGHLQVEDSQAILGLQILDPLVGLTLHGRHLTMSPHKAARCRCCAAYWGSCLMGHLEGINTMLLSSGTRRLVDGHSIMSHLWINHQGPATAPGDHDTILCGEGVSW